MADDQAAIGKQAREGLTLDRDHAVCRDGLDDGAVKDVATGIDLVGWWILGLFQKGRDPALRIRGHAAKGARIRHVEQVHGDIGTLVVVRGQDAF